MKNLRYEEIMAIIYQLIAIFVRHDMWHETAIFARQHVYASDEFWGRDLEPICVLHLVFFDQRADVYVYHADKSHRDPCDSKLLNVRFGSDIYLALYSYPPYIDIITAMGEIVAPHKMFFEFCDSHCLGLFEA